MAVASEVVSKLISKQAAAERSLHPPSAAAFSRLPLRRAPPDERIASRIAVAAVAVVWPALTHRCTRLGLFALLRCRRRPLPSVAAVAAAAAATTAAPSRGVVAVAK
jgi:hypothetical protein